MFTPLLLSFCFVSAFCRGQGTIQITFDGDPAVPPASVRPDYFEHHGAVTILFTNVPSGAFVRFGSASGFPDNGTAYLRPGAGGAGSIAAYLTDGSLFGLASVNLAGADSFTRTNFTTSFVGYRSDNSVVSTSFSGSGIDFQTFRFGPEFRDLTRVELPWSGFWSLDNLVIYIPEPSAGALLLAGGVAIGVLRFRRDT